MSKLIKFKRFIVDLLSAQKYNIVTKKLDEIENDIKRFRMSIHSERK